MSIMGTEIFQPPSNFSVLTWGTPSSMREMSVLVPPISKAIIFGSSMSSPRKAAPLTPPAGPERMAPHSEAAGLVDGCDPRRWTA